MEEVELKNVLIVNGEAMIVEKNEDMTALQTVGLSSFETPSTILSLNGLISLNGQEGINLVPQLENGHLSYAIQLDASSFELAPLPVITEVDPGTQQLPPKPKVNLPSQNKENQTRLKKKRRKIAPQISPVLQAPKEIQKPTLVESNLGVESTTPKIRPKSPLTRLTPSQLKQIADVIEKSRGSKTSIPSTLYDTETNTRIICRVVHPEDISANFKKKKRRRETAGESVDLSESWKTSASRTRSGRVSRPPKHMLKDYKGDKLGEDILTQKDKENTTSPAPDKPEETPQLESLSLRQKRNISSKFRCPTCQKVYLGYDRMRFHFDKYPDHRDNNLLDSIPIKPSKAPRLCRGFNVKGKGRAKTRSEAFDGLLEVCEERGFFKALSTWEFLLLKLDSVRDDKGKVAALCDELSLLVESVRGVASRIFHPANSPEDSKSYVLENDNASQVLGIPKGTYLTDESPLKSLRSPRAKEPIVEKPPIPPEDTYMLNNEMLCDAGLESVDQIVSERLETLGQDDVISCLGQLPDPNRSLDLMDGLLFTPPQLSTQNNVSDSTEDLMKSLESYASHIQAAEPPAPVIDFGVLSQDLGLNGVR